MNVLLDTHTFIWLDSAPEKLSQSHIENLLLISADGKFKYYDDAMIIW